MKRTVCIGTAVLLSFGFARSDAVDLPSRNAANLDKVEVGMSRERVLGIMGPGEDTFRQKIYFEGYIAGYQEVKVKNPYRSEMKRIDGDEYEIIYYFTDRIGLRTGYWDDVYKGKGIADEGLTPLVFKGDRLVGSGWGFIEEKTKKPLTVDEEYYWLYWGNGNGGGGH